MIESSKPDAQVRIDPNYLATEYDRNLDLVNHIVTTQLSNFLEPRHF